MNEEIFDIRYTQISDTTYLKEWIEDPQNLQWFPFSEDKEIEDAVQCWIGMSRWFAGLTATLEGTPCGMGVLFLMPYQKVAHQALFNLIINPSLQKQGVGSRLMKNLKHLAKTYFHLEFLSIEVFETSPIIAFLKKYDFYEVFRQDNYLKIDDSYQARVFLEVKL